MALRRGLAPIVIAIVVALVYWPGLHGFWTRDDFMQLAYARLVGSPWSVFLHDHYFPAPGSIFRPLGFASFWLSQALFGTDYYWNAFGDLVLHVAVALALYRVIRAGEIERVPAALCTLLFAVHPAVLGTALWWSARFDLLAMLFGLIAVRAALDHATRPRVGPLFVALAALLLALLSKEIALAAAAAVGLIWLRNARLEGAKRGVLLRAFAVLVVTVTLFFAWRTAVLGTATTGLAGDASLLDAFGRGIDRWFSQAPGYVAYSARIGAVTGIALIAAFVAAFVATSISRAAGAGSHPISSPRVDLFRCGVCLFLVPALVQAPVAGMNALPLGADASVIEAAMQSRLYYAAFGGLAICLATVVAHVWSAARMPRALLAAALFVGVVAFGWTSYRTADAFAGQTAASRGIAKDAVAAVDRAAATLTSRCRIVVLGVQPPPEWSIYVSIDSVAKALTSDVDRVGRCFVESDYVTYFNLMRGEANPADASPYTPRSANGRPIPWLRVGDMTAAYLDPPANTDAQMLAGIVFLRYENSAFVDVTADVASGSMPVTLR